MNKKTLHEKESDIRISISEELKNFILPLTPEEYEQLEKNLLEEGCRDPLIVWSKSNKIILVDGHNRLNICRKHGLPYKIKKREFQDIDEVKIWMADNQMGRRNLTNDQLSYYRGFKYLSLRKSKGGYQNVLIKGQGMLPTADILGDQFNVSGSTIKRDAKFAEGLNIIGLSNPKLKLQILSGKIKAKKADIQILANSKNVNKLSIKNEADLHNKAKLIRDEILDELETKINTISESKELNAKDYINENEPVFLEKEDRIRKIKGMIISAINTAINKKDKGKIKELRQLIERLLNEIFD